MNMTFHNREQVDLQDTTIVTAQDQHGRNWVLVATAIGEDIVITPSGLAVNPDLGPAVSDNVLAFVEWIGTTV